MGIRIYSICVSINRVIFNLYVYLKKTQLRLFELVSGRVEIKQHFIHLNKLDFISLAETEAEAFIVQTVQFISQFS